MSALAESLARGKVRARCASGRDADGFRRALRPLLHALVPFDAYCVNAADPVTLAITSSVGDGSRLRRDAMLRGLSDDEIATSLGVATQTVKAQAKAMFAKLDVAGRGGLLAKVDLAG